MNAAENGELPTAPANGAPRVNVPQNESAQTSPFISHETKIKALKGGGPLKGSINSKNQVATPGF